MPERGETTSLSSKNVAFSEKVSSAVVVVTYRSGELYVNFGKNCGALGCAGIVATASIGGGFPLFRV